MIDALSEAATDQTRKAQRRSTDLTAASSGGRPLHRITAMNFIFVVVQYAYLVQVKILV